MSLQVLQRFCGRLLEGKRTGIIWIGIFVLVLSGFAFYFSHVRWKSDLGTKKRTRGNASNGAELSRDQRGTQSPDLHDVSVVQHGRIIEVKGATDPDAIVMINGEPAATFFDGNSFKHFVGPIPPGTSIVTITVQNNLGGVTTRKLAVTID